MNQQAREALLAMIRRGDLTQQEAVAVYACVLFMIDHTDQPGPIQDEFRLQFGTYGMQGLDSLR